MVSTPPMSTPRPQAAQYLPPWRSPRRSGPGGPAGGRARRSGSRQHQRARQETWGLATGALPAFFRSRGAACRGHGRSLSPVQRGSQRGDQHAIEALEIVAHCTSCAGLRSSPPRHLPIDVRLARHGMRPRGQRASSGRAGNLRPAPGIAGSAVSWHVARAACAADLGRAARRGDAGRAGTALRTACPDHQGGVGRGHRRADQARACRSPSRRLAKAAKPA